MSVKELCGLPPIASLKQCLLTLSSRLITSDSTPSVSLVMKDCFPYLEPLGTIPDVQKRMLAAYDLVGGCNFLLLISVYGHLEKQWFWGRILVPRAEWLPLKYGWRWQPELPVQYPLSPRDASEDMANGTISYLTKSERFPSPQKHASSSSSSSEW